MKQFLRHLQFPHHVSVYIITKWWIGVVAHLGQELFKPSVVSGVAWCSLIPPPPHTHSQFIFCSWCIDMILHLQYLLVKSSAKICHLWQNGFDLCILVSVCRDYSTKPRRHDRGKVCCHVYEHVYVCKVGVTDWWYMSAGQITIFGEK